MRVLSLLLGIAIAMLLHGCSTGPTVGGQEPYRGQFAAGVVNPGGRYGSTIQRRLINALDASGRFAGVYPLRSSTQSSEVEIIIQPATLSARPGSGGFERIELRVTAFRKTSRKDRFNKTYRGKATGGRDALDDIAKPLVRELTKRFGERPVY
jgi:hypothetical protein